MPLVVLSPSIMIVIIIQNKTLSGKLERSDSRRCKKEFGNRCKRQFLIILLAVLFNLWTGTINFSFWLYLHNQFRINRPLIIDHHHLYFYRRIVGISRNWYHVVHVLIMMALDQKWCVRMTTCFFQISSLPGRSKFA